MDPQQPRLTDAPSALDKFQIRGLPNTAFYISNFISEEEEQLLLSKIAAAPKPRWKQLSHRRLQTWPSDLTRDTLLESPLPNWLTEPVVPRLLALANKDGHVFADSPHGRPNHVLINEYLPGQGIMPHKDGAAYYSVVCTVSLGSALVLDVYDTKEDGTRENEARWRILQEPRSLLITTGELYTNYLHGIADVLNDEELGAASVVNWDLLHSADSILEGRSIRRTRTSLTYRDVIKVAKLGGKFLNIREAVNMLN